MRTFLNHKLTFTSVGKRIILLIRVASDGCLAPIGKVSRDEVGILCHTHATSVVIIDGVEIQQGRKPQIHGLRL